MVNVFRILGRNSNCRGSSVHIAYARRRIRLVFWYFFYPSVKTDGNESKKILFIAVRYLADGAVAQRKMASAKISRLATI
jgi:hypothetical protein